MNKVRIAIIGLGRIGKIHFENMHFHIPEVEVKAVSDPHTRIETYGIPYLSLEEIMKHPEIDAVAICSPTNTHADYIEMAAKAGKHIFCEKPHDLDLARVKQSLQIVEECGVKFMLGFNRRFDPNFLRIRSLVEEGKVGNPLILKITSRDPGPPPVEYIKSSGGLFLDMAIHDFDMARYIMQKEVKEVYSKSAVFVDPAIAEAGDIDTAVTTLTFEDGSMAVIDNCRKAVYGYDQRLEVFGSVGMAKVENNFPDNHSLSDGSGVHSALPLNFFMERYTTSYLNETRMFVKALVEGAEVPASGVDGLQAMKIALAAKKSITENRPVAISEIK